LGNIARQDQKIPNRLAPLIDLMAQAFDKIAAKSAGKGETIVPDYDFRTQRLFISERLSGGAEPTLSREASHYLTSVLRMSAGDGLLVFNGQDGEWFAKIAKADKKSVTLALQTQTRQQSSLPDIDYLFAPLKHARLDYVVQKAVEMGAGRIRPVITRHTQSTRVNLERMQANIIEAAEQCGILSVPELCEEAKLADVLGAWDPARRLILCDERADAKDPINVLKELPKGPLAILIGPEGGFSTDEREILLALPFVIRLSLGPRILRADTAGVAALALVQSVCGDWAQI
jgi:16S rRNA (uracil1498-N3)-methyltransferase